MIPLRFSLCLIAAFGPALHGAEEPALAWEPREGAPRKLRLEYENSQRLELLDAEGQPIFPRPEWESRRRFSLEGSIAWTRVERAAASGKLRIESLRQAALESWSASEPRTTAIELDLRWRRGRRDEAELEATWSAADVESLAAALELNGRNAALARTLRELIDESLRELPRYAPPPDPSGGLRPGAKWKSLRSFELHGGLKLETATELEYVAAPNAGKKSARVEGSIRQSLPGGPPRLERHPGLFPGKVVWSHDLAEGFPELLHAQKTSRIPLCDEKLPRMKTLIHTYALRVGKPEAFPAGE